jgi:hypothetical protein
MNFPNLVTALSLSRPHLELGVVRLRSPSPRLDSRVSDLASLPRTVCPDDVEATVGPWAISETKQPSSPPVSSHGSIHQTGPAQPKKRESKKQTLDTSCTGETPSRTGLGNPLATRPQSPDLGRLGSCASLAGVPARVLSHFFILEKHTPLPGRFGSPSATAQAFDSHFRLTVEKNFRLPLDPNKIIA